MIPKQRIRAVGAMLAVTALAALALPGSAGARWVKGGEIVVGQGAAGVTLGMQRSDVVGLLGRPFYSNVHGYMQYAPNSSSNMFDVYCTGARGSDVVRMLGIAGGDFRIDGIRVFGRGGMGKLKRKYGRALRRTRLEDGEIVFRIRRTYLGAETWTDFSPSDPRHPSRSRVIQVFLLSPNV